MYPSYNAIMCRRYTLVHKRKKRNQTQHGGECVLSQSVSKNATVENVRNA